MKDTACVSTARGWSWGRIFDVWNARISADQRASEVLKSPFLELTWTPSKAKIGTTVLDWVPISELPELKADLAAGGRSGYRDVPPLHWLSEVARSRGAMQTVADLYAARNSPEMICAILLQGSIHELNNTSRGSRPMQGAITLRKCIKKLETIIQKEATRTFTWWHSCSSVMPFRRNAVQCTPRVSPMEALIKAFAEDHIEVLTRYQLVCVRTQAAEQVVA